MAHDAAANLLETAEGLKGVNFPCLVTLALGRPALTSENNRIKNIRGLVGLNFKDLEILNLGSAWLKQRATR